jgi:hypothetical protein
MTVAMKTRTVHSASSHQEEDRIVCGVSHRLTERGAVIQEELGDGLHRQLLVLKVPMQCSLVLLTIARGTEGKMLATEADNGFPIGLSFEVRKSFDLALMGFVRRL